MWWRVQWTVSGTYASASGGSGGGINAVDVLRKSHSCFYMCGFASAFFRFYFAQLLLFPICCTSNVEGKANARANTQEWKKNRADGWKVLATACVHIHQRNDRWNNVKKYSLAFRLGNGIGNGELVSSVAGCVVYLKLFSAKGTIGYFYRFCFLCAEIEENRFVQEHFFFFSFFRFFVVVSRASRFSIWSC